MKLHKGDLVVIMPSECDTYAITDERMTLAELISLPNTGGYVSIRILEHSEDRYIGAVCQVCIWDLIKVDRVLIETDWL